VFGNERDGEVSEEKQWTAHAFCGKKKEWKKERAGEKKGK
jgi:hypothetical protein